MGISSGSGGGGFKLEKTWRATGVGSTTFNSSSNFTIPFGKYEILVSGRAGTGNPDTPGNLAAYNPTVPSTLAGYNPDSPSNISGYNTETLGGPTGVYNPGSGGNLAGYTQSGGNFASTNPPTGGGFYVTEYVTIYTANPPGGATGNPTGVYNPGSGGNLAGYNPYVPGPANYNSPIPGGTATIYTTYVCEPVENPPGPGGGGAYIDVFEYNSFYQEYNINTFFGFPNYTFGGFFCPVPATTNQSVPTTPGTISNYNPPSGGNANYNPEISGNQNYNSPSPPTPPTFASFNDPSIFLTTCPAPYSSFAGPYAYGSTIYLVGNYSCSPVAGSPGTANYNTITNTAVYNPFVSGSQNYNSPTGGNALFNAAVVGNAVYNAAGGQNANYNTPSGGVAGTPTTVLGVYFPGGNAGAVAPFVPSTLINRYIADDTTYPITVPTGGFVTVQSK